MDVYNGGRWAKKLSPGDGSGGGSSSSAVVVVEEDGTVESVDSAAGGAPSRSEQKKSSILPTGGVVGEGEEDPAVTEAASGLPAAEAARMRILMGLPEPEPTLAKGLSASLPPEKLEALLAEVWAKRQAQVKEAWESFKTEGQQMATLLSSLEGRPGEDGAIVPLSHADFLGKLEDLEFHVSNVHNAEDFAAGGGLLAMARYLNSTEEGVAARAAWVIGSAVKGQSNLVEVALAEGVGVALVGMLRGVLRDGEVCVAAAGVPGGGELCDPSPHLRTLAKGVYAVGGLTRFHEGAQREFSMLGGPQLLARALNLSSGVFWGGGGGEAVATGGEEPSPSRAAARSVAMKTRHLLADLALPIHEAGEGPNAPTSNLLKFRLDALNASPRGEGAANTTTNSTPSSPPSHAGPTLVRVKTGGGGGGAEALSGGGEPERVSPSFWLRALEQGDGGVRGSLCGSVGRALSSFPAAGGITLEELERVRGPCGEGVAPPLP